MVSPELLEETIALRRDLHAHPELSFEERRTASLVADRLRALGLDVHAGIGKTGVVGLLEGKTSGPTIMLRADMDALPMPEANHAPYRSQNAGVAHACGHDAHVAMLLGAAKILCQRASEVQGRIALVFQPAEEAGGGADAMLRDGLIERFAIERAYGLHVISVWPGADSPAGLPPGTFGLRPGPLLAGVANFDLVIEGRGGHGAMPHLSIDPVVIAAEVITALQRILSREIDPIEPAVLTVGAINGGTTYNVIPQTVSLKGAIRWFGAHIQARLERRIKEIAEHVCAAAGAKASLTWMPPCPATVNDPQEAAFVQQTLGATFGRERVLEVPPFMGSEDFSCYQRVVPSCFYLLGAGDKARPFPNHHPAFDIDESVLAEGIQAHVAIGLAATATEFDAR